MKNFSELHLKQIAKYHPGYILSPQKTKFSIFNFGIFQLMKTFQIRAAQLDLARQMETLDFIFEFIDMISDNGYNAVFLYLEDRIITPSYTLPQKNEAYSRDQIRQIVDYASARNIEVIPCVATLGHAERFLRFPQLEHLAEVRNGSRDRFGGTAKDTFCVSTPEFYDFLFAYLDEILPLFPSKYFHAGLDEFWNFNICELCRAKIKTFHDEELLFLEHIKKVHNYLGSRGKRMAMWPDMFENYHSILPDVPRDIIMTEWQYQRDVRTCQAHFNNLTEENTLERYRKLGIEVWASPADMHLSNGQSFINYASKYENVTGFLQTAWEKSDTFMYRTWPITAANGRKAAGATDEEAFKGMIKSLFGTDDELFILAQKSILHRGFSRHFGSISPSVLWSRSIFGFDAARPASIATDQLILTRYKDKISAGHVILEDQLLSLEELVFAARIKQAMLKQLDSGCCEDTMNSLKQDFSHYLSIFRKREESWDTLRPGITPNVFTQKLPGIEKRFAEVEKNLENGSFLRVRRMHCDWYGMPKLRISLRVDGQWHEIHNGCAKPDNLEIAEFDFFHAFDRKFLKADAVRFEHNGYGGLGLCFFAVCDNGKMVKVPGKILETENGVRDADFLLTDDSRFCFLGNQNMYEAYVHQELVSVMHRVDAELKDYHE